MQVKLDNALALAEYRAELAPGERDPVPRTPAADELIDPGPAGAGGEAPAELVAMANENRSLMHRPLTRRFPRARGRTPKLKASHSAGPRNH